MLFACIDLTSPVLQAETIGLVMGSNEPDRIKRLEKQARRLEKELNLLSSSPSWRSAKRQRSEAGLKTLLCHENMHSRVEVVRAQLARAISWERRCSVSV